MINTREFFEPLMASALEHNIWTHDAYTDWQFRFEKGWVIVQVDKEFLDKDVEAFPITFYTTFSDILPKAVTENVDFPRELNRANASEICIQRLAGDRVVGAIPLVAYSYDHRDWVEPIAEYFSGNRASSATLAELEAQWHLVIRGTYDVDLLELGRTDKLIVWRFPFDEGGFDCNIKLVARDYNGCPYVAIAIRVPEIFYENHAIARTAHMFHPIYKYDYDTTNTDAIMKKDELTDDPDFRQWMTFHYNNMHAIPNLGTRMWFAEETTLAWAEVRLPAFIAWDQRLLFIAMDTAVKAYFRQYDSDPDKRSTGKKLFDGLMEWRKIWKFGKMLVGG